VHSWIVSGCQWPSSQWADYTLSRHHFVKSRLALERRNPRTRGVYSQQWPYSNLVVVQAFATQIDADIAKAWLESARHGRD